MWLRKKASSQIGWLAGSGLLSEDELQELLRLALGPVLASDMVERGQALFVIEATDTVQALNDFIASLGALNTARSGVRRPKRMREKPGFPALSPVS
jgi:hypothetical protein